MEEKSKAIDLIEQFSQVEFTRLLNRNPALLILDFETGKTAIPVKTLKRSRYVLHLYGCILKVGFGREKRINAHQPMKSFKIVPALENFEMFLG